MNNFADHSTTAAHSNTNSISIKRRDVPHNTAAHPRMPRDTTSKCLHHHHHLRLRADLPSWTIGTIPLRTHQINRGSSNSSSNYRSTNNTTGPTVNFTNNNNKACRRRRRINNFHQRTLRITKARTTRLSCHRRHRSRKDPLVQEAEEFRNSSSRATTVHVVGDSSRRALECRPKTCSDHPPSSKSKKRRRVPSHRLQHPPPIFSNTSTSTSSHNSNSRHRFSREMSSQRIRQNIPLIQRGSPKRRIPFRSDLDDPWYSNRPRRRTRKPLLCSSDHRIAESTACNNEERKETTNRDVSGVTLCDHRLPLTTVETSLRRASSNGNSSSFTMPMHRLLP